MIIAVASSGVWRQVTNGKDRFEVKLRSPSYDDRLRDQSLKTEYALATSISDRVSLDRDRIDWYMGFVEEWREVYAESGERVPFSPDSLHQLIVAYPRVMLGIVSHVEKLLASELSETQRGN
jgi:hypothetical protein